MIEINQIDDLWKNAFQYVVVRYKDNTCRLGQLTSGGNLELQDMNVIRIKLDQCRVFIVPQYTAIK
jgi:hypothetical protein